MIDVVYAQADDGTHIAYRVLDADPTPEPARDIVMVSGGLFPLELFEEEPGFARLLDGLRALGRVIAFDRRGIGQSDPIQDWERAVVDQWTDDLAAVVDASGAHDIVLVAWDGYGVGSRYAAMHPERVSALVLYEPFVVADDEWESWSAYRLQRGSANLRGEDDILTEVAPSRVADREFPRLVRAGRPAGREPIDGPPNLGISDARSSADGAALSRSFRRRSSFTAATICSPLTTSCTRLAARVPHAAAVELEGRDHFPFVGDVDALVAEIVAFVVGERRLPPPQRLLSAVLFTDLVGSTERAAALGDEDWKSVLDRHDAGVRTIVGRCGGSVVKTTGDGVLALLPSAGVCLRAAAAVRRTWQSKGSTCASVCTSATSTLAGTTSRASR